MRRCPNPDCHGFIEKGAAYCGFCMREVNVKPADGGVGRG